MRHYDVVIVGGGMVGSTLACLLAQQDRSIAIIEAFSPKDFSQEDQYDLRVSAINPFSQEVLMQANAWSHIQSMRSTAYEQMHVWDATGDGEIHFDSADIGESHLGHIIENRVVQIGLLAAIESYDNIDLHCPTRLQQFHQEDRKIIIDLDDGNSLSTSLLVGADGAKSKVRTLANIAVDRNDYGQHGLVTTVVTEKQHQHTAWQRFMPSGPLAFLPLGKNHSSIVWTLPSDKVDFMLKISEDEFKRRIADALDNKLGAITELAQRAAFPLKGSQARNYVQSNLALIGDAAHTIHPLAGLGVNLGIKDAAKLAEVLAKASSNQLGKYSVLRRYERARRGDNLLTMRAMEGFRALFGNSLTPIRNLRNFGLSWANQSIIKRAFIYQAMGKSLQ